ncbi:MerR family transcriptional regulator [Streptomyces sp. 891-h]|uniref:MerR family transcriptional regulator n=1 Tax=unclassified Streptomyces TaxID=2593676 RepID=UPI001FAA9F8F|nr:MerR family transcriptional regulator [Streptomyces sp. 891-h]UNZ19191.1 MerR family transcriptional regulator [Streptomyces sp. 891-h]
MRIAELSRLSGVPAPTIKYYVRESLLAPGERTSRNQAQYDERHVTRLRLIRALLEVGGLSVAAVRDVIAALDSPETGTHKVLGAAQQTVTATGVAGHHDEPGHQEAVAEIRALVERQGWEVSEHSPALTAAAEVLSALRRLGQDDFADQLDAYARAADAVAAVDLEIVRKRPDADSMAEAVILGNILGDALLAALRRLAQIHRSGELFD